MQRAAAKLNRDRVALLNKITSHIRQSLELQVILDNTVAEVRSLIKTDRVKIYKFDDRGNGEVIAESINKDRLSSLKGLHFPAGDIPPQARELFCKARVRSIVNIEQQQIMLSAGDRPLSTATGELTAEEVRKESLDNLLKRPVDPCHVEYLSLMGVKSSLVVPILNDNRLWGLLISHHATQKQFDRDDLQILEMIANQLEFAISQANLLDKVQQKARREESINRVFSLLHSTLETENILPEVLKETIKAANGSGGTLLLVDPAEEGASFYTHGEIPQLTGKDWVKMLKLNESNPKIRVIEDLQQEPELKPFLPELARKNLGNMITIPLKYRNSPLGSLTLFRQKTSVEKLWAGYQDTADDRQNRPRQSFEEWREIQKNVTQKWCEEDFNLIKGVGSHLAMAVIQDRLYHQEKKQRMLVEIRNRELDRARAIAQEASRLKSNFLSSTSHELRTPLAATLNYLKLLKEEYYDNIEELKEFVEAAYISTENLVEIINDVLDIAKIESGRMTVEIKKIQLEPILAEQMCIFKQQSIVKGVDLRLDRDVDWVWADPVKLRQILTNLLSNAFKFTDRGSISLEVKRQKKAEKSLVIFSVSDTGIGIEGKKQELLFEAFVQADGSIRRKYGGTGLGLAICKQLVELMGGQIWLRSAGKNLGTTVSFTLSDRGTEDNT